MDGQQFVLLAVQNDRLLHLGGVATNRLARGLPGLPLTTDPKFLTCTHRCTSTLTRG